MQVLTYFFVSSVSNQSIPLIPWTSEQEEAFSSPTFRQLLGELGFHLPSDTGKLFPRIPHFWCPDVLFMVAKRLGDITESKFLLHVLASVCPVSYLHSLQSIHYIISPTSPQIVFTALIYRIFLHPITIF